MNIAENHDFRSRETVSVIIPAYNAEVYIRRSIDSVLLQTYPANEVIVIDDGSTDHTTEILKNYMQQVQYIYQNNAGASAARNVGIKRATSKWIAFLDADDEWMPNKLEEQIQVVTRNKTIVWIGANYYTRSSINNRCSPYTIPAKIEKLLSGKEYFNDYFAMVLSGVMPCTDTILIKKEVFDEIGYFDLNLRRGQDTDMWMRIAYRWPKIGFLSVPLATYHIETDRDLMRKQINLPTMLNFYDKHLELSAKFSQSNKVKPILKHMISITIRGLLFQNCRDNIRLLLKRYQNLFSIRYKVFIYILTIYPRFTTLGCHAISKFIRFFNLRRRVVPLPKKLK